MLSEVIHQTWVRNKSTKSIKIWPLNKKSVGSGVICHVSRIMCDELLNSYFVWLQQNHHDFRHQYHRLHFLFREFNQKTNSWSTGQYYTCHLTQARVTNAENCNCFNYNQKSHLDNKVMQQEQDWDVYYITVTAGPGSPASLTPPQTPLSLSPAPAAPPPSPGSSAVWWWHQRELEDFHWLLVVVVSGAGWREGTAPPPAAQHILTGKETRGWAWHCSLAMTSKYNVKTDSSHTFTDTPPPHHTWQDQRHGISLGLLGRFRCDQCIIIIQF